MSERVLSIQSHVSFGYVGGKAAVFPLQCLGYDVDVVNSVNFSNHSGYGRFGGSKATPEDLIKIFNLMEQNGLLSPSRLLTGYIPGGEALTVIAQLAKKLRSNNPDLIYLLDPVLGDSGKLYVSPDVVPIYRSILPLATIITPNWFEVETLTEVRLTNVDALRRALAILHEQYRVPHVVVSSMPLVPPVEAGLPAILRSPKSSEDLICISSSFIPDHSKRANPPELSSVFVLRFPCLPGYFSGVGDLFSALVLAHYRPSLPTLPQSAPPTQTPLSIATSHALSKTFSILEFTSAQLLSLPEEERTLTDDEADGADPERKVKRMRGRELKLIQGQDILRGERPIETRWMAAWEDFWHSK
ncbi:bud site selection protein 16 [Schizopora paradoxa]|uniref:pyridoxal kinase n=1 Tax=Schizopora paradoxa TaxID=27342 RepID=A0A0H2RDF5_9AGAM|nr:bud site selection protein 16 [Schizopora paradoxa]